MKLKLLLGFFLGLGFSAGAVTFTNERSHISFPSPDMTAYVSGFPYSSGGGADMALDSSNNPHIMSTEGNIGHRGGAQYRRWTHASQAWSGAYLDIESGTGLDDNYYGLVAVDAADRVHILYHHRIATNTMSDTTTPYDVYHMWCTNASGATPLSLGNWNKTIISQTVPDQMKAGCLINIGSNILLYARGGIDITSDTFWDIRIERAEWDGSSWTWSSLGAVLSVANSHLHTPRLMYDTNNNLLHMDLRDENYIGTPRSQVYTCSSQPENPTSASWAAPVWHGAISVQWKEGNGGTGIMEDGEAIALVYLGGNRDNMSSAGAPANFTRVREAGSGGTWGSWFEVFPGDSRTLGNGLGYGGHVDFAPDGFGGMFFVYGKSFVSHWDSETEDWCDVFTNLYSVADNTAICSIAVKPEKWPDLSTLYYYRCNNRTLYVGKYLEHRVPCRILFKMW